MRKPFNALSNTDIKFLNVVDQINSNPEDYPYTDAGPTPANTTSIKKVTNLSDRQVSYRIKPYDDGTNRGLDDLGYITTHDPEFTESGFSARGVELTDEGQMAVSAWEEKHGEVEPEEWDQTTVRELELEIEQLRSKVDQLENTRARSEQVIDQLDHLEDRLNSIDENEFGGVNEDAAQKMGQTFTLVARFYEVFEDIFGLTIDDLGDDISPEEAREQIREQLLGDEFQSPPAGRDAPPSEVSPNAHPQTPDQETKSE